MSRPLIQDSLSSKQFKNFQCRLGLSSGTMAEKLNISIDYVQKMRRGAKPVPAWVVQELKRLQQEKTDYGELVESELEGAVGQWTTWFCQEHMGQFVKGRSLMQERIE